MKVRACQLGADLGALPERMAAIERLIVDAASSGVDVVVFPELALTGYGAGDAIREGAEKLDGPTVSAIRRLADRHDVTVVAGLALLGVGRLFNAALMARPGLPPIAYAKQHLYGSYEKALFSPGTSPSDIVDVGGMKAGLLVCFDVEFPERVRELARAGAEVVFVPTALPRSAGARFIAETVIPVRAFENHIFVVYVDHVGADERFTYQGLSSIVAPDGARLAAAPDDAPASIDATLDLSSFAASLEQNPYMAELEAQLRRAGS